MTDPCVACGTTGNQVRAEIGRLCSGCSNATLRHLRQIEALALALDATPVVSGQQVHSRAFGPSIPLRLDVVDATDPRSRPSLDEPDQGALGLLCGWTRLVAYERDARQPDAVTVAGECGFLRTHHGWIVGQSWVDEYVAAVRYIRDTLRRLVGLQPDAPVGVCMVVGCDGAVFPRPEQDGVQCVRCRRRYSGLDLARLHVAQPGAA